MNEKIKNKRKWLIITLAIILLVTIIGCIIWWQRERESKLRLNTTKEYVIAVLDKKYGEKFAIDSAKYVWTTDSYNFIAHPINEPEFKFTAQLGHISQSGVTDQYLSYKRFFEVRNMISPFIEEVSSNNIIVCANLLYRNTSDEEFKAIIRKKLTTSDILKSYPDKSGVYIEAYVAVDITPQTEDHILKSIYNMINFLKEKKFGEIKIEIYFFDQNYFKDKSIKDEYNKYENYGGIMTRLKDKYICDFCIYPQNVEKIKNFKDLKKHIYPNASK